MDLYQGQVVRLLQGRKDKLWVYGKDPVAVAQKWKEAGARRLHVVDLDGAFEGEPRQLHWVRRIVESTGLALQLGGGIRSEWAVEQALESGARWILLGTVAAENPSLAAQIVRRFGSDRIGVALDARKERVVTRGWVQRSQRTVMGLALELRAAGIERFLYTDTSVDGTLGGPDMEGIEKLVGSVGGLWMASGGIGGLEDLRKLARVGGLYGVVVGRALYEERLDLREALSLEGVR
ncbi:1-(5-phosphoribosyl)-5-[(5-phosphoribosylamino)methylideneamino]imidazole-4-carboxamide isomerase [Candidatus Methylacidithermus pantelleriae]|uniref:1-(5-phosphoribosyl)-5-[(5-phosphoribosylamino)methylideneamino] imidazole-4-carboxamide isomerase n=1 Tax=Candidatus Methylacidithermus pantelleriae TaxID=2744239 RepID=A0A8J2BK35_9BACT|nr:1-(5-phosphoribosyl)-5-[(5-phosphoribosylamino)methylideneamino] imidazole-4-carboxamide isomerase [Candidatus Methylacidithermus pantelleriae]CAF0694955.1 1-(5-phosphoribosyl)-5-((5-phosphoribosylamino)methylideneamino) imidazole-4-carboxamide isomerase [Candidatus Methylacidithermus pantelleriae]